MLHRKNAKRVMLDDLGRPLRHRGWGGDLKQRDRKLQEEVASVRELTDHPQAGSKFGDGPISPDDYALLKEMEGR